MLFFMELSSRFRESSDMKNAHETCLIEIESGFLTPERVVRELESPAKWIRLITEAVKRLLEAEAGFTAEAVRRSFDKEKTLRSIVEQAPVMIWVSGVDKLCTYFNRSWLRYTGRPMEEERGNGWSRGVHPDDLERCFATYCEAFDAREPFCMGYRLRRADGRYGLIVDQGMPLVTSSGCSRVMLARPSRLPAPRE